MAKIVVCEDDAGIRRELVKALAAEGYLVEAPEEFQDVAGDILNRQPDLVLLDINLPRASGFDVLREMKRRTDVPVIFVTSREADADEFYGLTLGAEDYVVKPYSLPVLLARVKKALARGAGAAALSVRGVTLDTATAKVSANGRTAELTKNELRILHALMSRHGRIVPPDEIISEMWESRLYVDENTLNVNIARLRKKLREIGAPDFIVNKRGMGYLV